MLINNSEFNMEQEILYRVIKRVMEDIKDNYWENVSKQLLEGKSQNFIKGTIKIEKENKSVKATIKYEISPEVAAIFLEDEQVFKCVNVKLKGNIFKNILFNKIEITLENIKNNSDNSYLAPSGSLFMSPIGDDFIYIMGEDIYCYMLFPIWDNATDMHSFLMSVIKKYYKGIDFNKRKTFISYIWNAINVFTYDECREKAILILKKYLPDLYDDMLSENRSTFSLGKAYPYMYVRDKFIKSQIYPYNAKAAKELIYG